MTPEQVEAILQSNAKAIEANSNAIAESRRQISALYQLNAELLRDRATMFEILQGLNEDRVRTAEKHIYTGRAIEQTKSAFRKDSRCARRQKLDSYSSNQTRRRATISPPLLLPLTCQ